MTKFALVGDVGGTNARLALCDLASGEISRAKTYSGLDYPSLEAVVRVYLEEHQVTVNEGCIAIACPITGDWVAMTNHTWAFSIAEMKRNLGFAHLEIINDFTAVSMAIPMLKAEHLIQFGGSAPVAGKPIAVYGAGTGLGVAHLVHVDKRWVSLPGEGGHVDFAPNSEEEGDHSGRATRRAGACFRRTRALRSRAGQPVSRDCQIGRPTAGEPAAA